VRHRLRHDDLDQTVIAPRPFLPRWAAAIPKYRVLAAIPAYETRFGLAVWRPSYPALPRLSVSLSPLLMYRWVRPLVRRLLVAGFDFDLIDAHYFYPDGAAAALLGREFSRPVVITASGTDLNVLPRYAVPRRWIRYAAGRAAGLVTVSLALKHQLTALGVAAERIAVIANGVDLEMFRPADKASIRTRHLLSGTVLLSVGNLLPFKGHDIAVSTLPLLPDATLLIAGSGPDHRRLKRLAQDCGVTERVRFLGQVAHRELSDFYAAADVLVHMSSREGMPNVVLEAMACGTPVVAGAVGGIPEIVSPPLHGRLLPSRTPQALAEAVNELSRFPPDRSAIRRRAEEFTWETSTQRQTEQFSSILSSRRI
jgi:teichuronic acid biosynthesis glycosyltransferase TuaC